MKTPPQAHTREHRLIKLISEWTGERLIGDDCAVLPGGALATADSLIEGRHFLRSLAKLEDIGWKSLAVNVSDIAAMGGAPQYALVSLTLPDSFEEKSLARLYAGMLDCAGQTRTKIIGGDLTGGPCLMIAITVLGQASEFGSLRRSGARRGDYLAVTGSFGQSAAGLWALQAGVSGFEGAKASHLRPCAKLAEGRDLALRSRGRCALMDASDGLADAAVQIAAASGFGANIQSSKIPISEETKDAASKAGVDPLEWALYGGEDYELVAAAPRELFADWKGCPFVIIGEITEGEQVQVDGRSLDLSKSFQHWREDAV